MSFTSLTFIFGFVPLVYLGFVVTQRLMGAKMGINFLALASLGFYGMWGAQLLMILLVSLVFNFALGNILPSLSADNAKQKNLLTAGILMNLAMLGYLKYSNFFIDVANQTLNVGFEHLDIAVPIGVSFFTFVQIGFLIDAYNGKLIKHDFGRYIIFAAFFPCVTAGPLVMQNEMMSQLENQKLNALDMRRVLIGVTMFAMGLFKKVVMADSIAPFADTVFNSVHAGADPNVVTAWVGALSYALQLYFDFSGYSDMAIGLGTIFGIKLPLNFDSPFKATNISDFWRRWHMTMTRFFTSYIYSGLAMNGMRKAMGNRASRFGRYLLCAAIPSFTTFLCAGVWHGAGWNYVVYGALHGLAIATFLGWREFSNIKIVAPVAWALTMITVVCGLVLFRSPDLYTAGHMLADMFGIDGIHPGSKPVIVDSAQALSLIVILSAVTLLLPNSQQILHHEWPVVDSKPAETALNAGLVAWRPSIAAAFICACIFTIGVTSIGASSGFVYYKF
jgi:alginate O-acetyltransferase complex protein AlgI